MKPSLHSPMSAPLEHPFFCEALLEGKILFAAWGQASFGFSVTPAASDYTVKTAILLYPSIGKSSLC